MTGSSIVKMQIQTKMSVLESAELHRDFLKKELSAGAGLNTALEKFHFYTPQAKSRDNVVGIDGSNNSSKKFGFTFDVISVVAITKQGETISVNTECGFDLNSNKDRMIMEATTILENLKDSHIVADGSIYNLIQLPESNKFIQRIPIKSKFDLVFVAKTSTSRQFAFGPFTDMAYFGNCTSETGFSEPYVDRISVNKIVTSTYVRLAKDCPLIKIEILGEKTIENIKDIIDWLSSTCVNGYPYELQLAHDTCKITGDDLLEIESMIGISSIPADRDVLRDNN
jgi:hypothetical protein